MKSSLAALVVGVAACLHPGVAWGDDALDALVRAGKNSRAAHVWRATIVTTNAAEPGKSSVCVIERVDPGLTHYRQESEGQKGIEIYGSGRRALIRVKLDKEFEEADPSVAVFLARMRQASIWPLAQGLKGEVLSSATAAKDLRVAGHTIFGGKPTTIYAFSADSDGMHQSGERWISDEDSLLLKSVGDRKGEVKTQKGTVTQVDEHSETIFDYDPTIKIVLPEEAAPVATPSGPEVTKPESAVSFALPPAAVTPSFPCASFSSIVFPASAVT